MGAYVSLAVVLLLAGAAVAAAAVYLMARGLVRPPRMNDGKALYLLNRLTPKDLGLAYESVTFHVRDERTGQPLPLAAWWIPAADGGRGGTNSPGGGVAPGESRFAGATGRTVLLVHGYADAKVGALAWVPAWRELGFDVLAVDLRAHGDSGGTVCSAGYHERHDLVQVVHQLLARNPAAGRTLMLFGASLGAAVVAAAAELLDGDPGTPLADGRGSIVGVAGERLAAGVVLESPFADFRSAAAAHLDRLGLPGGRLRDAAVRLAGRLADADFAAVRPADVVGRLRCPVLVLAAGDDVYVSDAEAAELERSVNARPAAAAGPGVYRRFEGVEHLMAVVDAPDGYRAALGAFAREVVDRGR